MREHLVLGGLLQVERGQQLLVVDVDQLGRVAGLGRARATTTATISPAKATGRPAIGGWSA